MANPKEYQNEYIRNNIKRYTVSLNVGHDEYIIDWLDSHKPFTQYIRALIDDDMRRNGIEVPERVDGRLKDGQYIGWRDKYSKDAKK